MDLSFQFANQWDEAPVQRLIESVWPDLYRPHVTMKTISRLLTDGINAHVKLTIDGTVVAKAKGRVVGVVSVNFGWISGLCVSADYRMCGVGSRLLAIARSQGGMQMEVHAFNLAARRFVENRGWKCYHRYLDDMWESELEAFSYRCVDRATVNLATSLFPHPGRANGQICHFPHET